MGGNQGEHKPAPSPLGSQVRAAGTVAVASALRHILYLLMAGLSVAANIAIKAMLSFAVEEGSRVEELMNLLFDVTLLGGAIIIAGCGVILTIKDSFQALRR